MAKRCLIIESDQIWADRLRSAFSSLAIDARSVSHHEDAIREIRSGNYDLITLDLFLSQRQDAAGGDKKEFAWGKNLLATVRATVPSPPPIIIVSGTEDFSDVLDCINHFRELVCHFSWKRSWDYVGFMEAVTDILTHPHATRTRVGRPSHCKLFIAHGPATEALSKLCEFLVALELIPLVVEWLPSEGRSINENVEHYLEMANGGVVLATQDDIVDGRFQPRANVSIELGRFQERFPTQVVYLLEEGVQFPSNVSEKVWERFTGRFMDRAFLKLVRELKAVGLL
jgi:Predicted nucleotide-binding protein containing TIR-like domain